MVHIPINITGGTYKHKSLALSAQVTRNFLPQLQTDNSTKSPYILESFAGLKLFSTQTGGVDRGLFVHKEVLYKVTGTTFYLIEEDGTHVAKGTVEGAERCIIDGLQDTVLIVTAGRVYKYNVVTDTFTDETSAPNFESPNSVTVLNSQAIYDGDGDRFAVSDVGDGTSINALNYAQAESKADDLVRPYAFNQRVYMLGKRTVEIWWNSGTGTPPFARVEGGIRQVGLSALHCVGNSDEFMYFLGTDNQVYAMSGSQLQVVSQQPLTREISKYTKTSDAFGWCTKYQGQWMFIMTFPSASKTWVYPEGGEWFELSDDAMGNRWIGNSYAFAYRKHFVADYQNGNLYELDDDTYTNNGNEIIRMRDTGVIHGGLIGQDGKEITMGKFELYLQTGVGLLSGQGSDPKIMLSYSDDGGQTWSEEQWGYIGKLGDFVIRVTWDAQGSFLNRIIRVSTSDPVYYSIHSASAELEVGI